MILNAVLKYTGSPTEGLKTNSLYTVETRAATDQERNDSYGGTIWVVSIDGEAPTEPLCYGPDQFWAVWTWHLPRMASRKVLCLNDSIIYVSSGIEGDGQVEEAYQKLNAWARAEKKYNLNFRVETVSVGIVAADVMVEEQKARYRNL